MRLLVFAGRKHHKEKLQNVFNELSKDHDVHWLISNNAINIDPPEEFLVDSGDKFIHAYHWLNENSSRAIQKLVDYTNLSHLYEYVPPFWVEYSLREAGELISAFGNVLENTKPHGILILHSNNFFAKVLAYVAQELNIPVFAFQEGLLRDRDQETLKKQTYAGEYTDVLFTWSREAKRSYIKAGLKNDQLYVSGPSHLEHYARISQLNARKKSFNTDKKIVLFAPTIQKEYHGNITDDYHALKSICDKNGWVFVFKPHPMEEKGYNLPNKYTGDSYIAIKAADALISQHSSIAPESLLLGTPVIEFNTTDEKILHSFAERDMAIRSSPATIEDDLQQLLSETTELINQDKIDGYVNKNFGKPIGSSYRIAQKIEKVCKSRS